MFRQVLTITPLGLLLMRSCFDLIRALASHAQRVLINTRLLAWCGK
jgi:hypothetical protein